MKYPKVKSAKGVGMTKPKGGFSAKVPALNGKTNNTPVHGISPKGTTGGIVKTAGGEMLRNSAAGK